MDHPARPRASAKAASVKGRAPRRARGRKGQPPPADVRPDHELRSLLAMSTELARSLEPNAVGDLIARHIATATGVDECGVS